MTENFEPQDIAKKTIVYKVAGMDDVVVGRDIEYSVCDSGPLKMDIYYPPEANPSDQLPVVIFVIGYPGAGFQRIFGCEQKEMASYVSWAKLAAASGVAAIIYNNREPVADLDALLEYVRPNGSILGIDENKIGIWSCSGNVPTALSMLMQNDSDYMKCAVLCYGVMIDIDGSTDVVESAAKWGFANPATRKSVEDISPNVPIFIARAGQDEMPHLNESIDRFVANALNCNLPITFVNHANGPHWFDVMDDSKTSREIIRQILAFMRFHLLE